MVKLYTIHEFLETFSPEEILDIAEEAFAEERARGDYHRLWFDEWVKKLNNAQDTRDFRGLLECGISACEEYLKFAADPSRKGDPCGPWREVKVVWLELDLINAPLVDVKYYRALAKMKLGSKMDNPHLVSILLNVFKEMTAGTLQELDKRIKQNIERTYKDYCRARCWTDDIFSSTNS